jgi:hypothetical protein
MLQIKAQTNAAKLLLHNMLPVKITESVDGASSTT